MTPTSREIVKSQTLPQNGFSRVWADHELSESAMATLALWLDADLAQLEERFRGYETRRSVAKSLNR